MEHPLQMPDKIVGSRDGGESGSEGEEPRGEDERVRAGGTN